MSEAPRAATLRASLMIQSLRDQIMQITSTNALRVVALCCSSGLVIASAGLGAVYAYTVGSEHGIALAGLTVLMAVALEGSKPLAIAATFTSFRKFKIAQGIALALLGAVAVAYSLTAELSLISMSRGDLVAERASQADLRSELKSMAPARPAAEVQAEIAAIDVLPGILVDGVPCGGTLNGKVTREWCPKRAELLAEKARAERKAVIEGKLSDSHQVQTADPGSTALATYLSALGILVPVPVIGQWLNLVPVLALEIGSALAAVLVQAVSGPGVVQAQKPKKTAPSVRTATEAKVLKELKKRKELPASERGLAALIGGVSRSTARRAIHSLVAAGVVAMEASRNGTILRLVA